jgi:hypothetical protein
LEATAVEYEYEKKKEELLHNQLKQSIGKRKRRIEENDDVKRFLITFSFFST